MRIPTWTPRGTWSSATLLVCRSTSRAVHFRDVPPTGRPLAVRAPDPCQDSSARISAALLEHPKRSASEPVVHDSVGHLHELQPRLLGSPREVRVLVSATVGVVHAPERQVVCAPDAHVAAIGERAIGLDRVGIHEGRMEWPDVGPSRGVVVEPADLDQPRPQGASISQRGGERSDPGRRHDVVCVAEQQVVPARLRGTDVSGVALPGPSMGADQVSGQRRGVRDECHRVVGGPVVYHDHLEERRRQLARQRPE